MKIRSELTPQELKTDKYFLPLRYANFYFFEAEFYVESLRTGKTYKLEESFIGAIEKVQKVSTFLEISKDEYLNFRYLDEFNISIDGIVFKGDEEIIKLLKWMDKIL